MNKAPLKYKIGFMLFVLDNWIFNKKLDWSNSVFNKRKDMHLMIYSVPTNSTITGFYFTKIDNATMYDTCCGYICENYLNVKMEHSYDLKSICGKIYITNYSLWRVIMPSFFTMMKGFYRKTYFKTISGQKKEFDSFGFEINKTHKYGSETIQ